MKELTWLVGSTTAWVVARWAIGRMEAVCSSLGVTRWGVMWAWRQKQYVC